MQMRRKDREISREDALEILENCCYATLATTGAEDGAPYCVAVSPVLVEGAVYFHCAQRGEKIENLRKDNRVCLCCVSNAVPQPEQFAMVYASAVATGRAYPVVAEEEKRMALRALCAKYAPGAACERVEKEISDSFEKTAVYKIILEHITGKAKRE